ncbi:MAG: SprB repeat-containing protein, partial [Salinivirgaceae bacterium]
MKNFYISLFILLLINLFSFELKAQFSQVSSTCLGDFTITDGILNKEEEINGYQVTLDGTFKLEIIIPESNKIVLSYHTNFSIENGDLLEIYSSSTTNLPLKTYNGSNDPTASTKDTIPSGRAILLYTNGGNTKTNLNINWTGLLSVTADITNPTCSDSNDGAINLNNPGTSPFTISWTGPDTFSESTEDISNLGTAGDYTISMTDANGCVFNKTYTLTKPNAINYTQSGISNFNGANVSCYGGSNGWVEIAGNGGTAPYNYLWSDANNQTTKKPINLTAGTYDVTISDNNGCTNTFASAATITQPAVALTITDTTSATYNGYHLKCKDDTDASLALIVSGGTGVYNYN